MDFDSTENEENENFNVNDRPKDDNIKSINQLKLWGHLKAPFDEQFLEVRIFLNLRSCFTFLNSHMNIIFSFVCRNQDLVKLLKIYLLFFAKYIKNCKYD